MSTNAGKSQAAASRFARMSCTSWNALTRIVWNNARSATTTLSTWRLWGLASVEDSVFTSVRLPICRQRHGDRDKLPSSQSSRYYGPPHTYEVVSRYAVWGPALKSDACASHGGVTQRTPPNRSGVPAATVAARHSSGVQVVSDALERQSAATKFGN